MTIIYAGETIQHSISNLVEDKVDYNNQELCRRFNLLFGKKEMLTIKGLGQVRLIC
jgi:hypothetical protein